MNQLIREQLNKIRGVEFTISKNLYAICSIITVVTIIMFLVEFFGRGEFPSPGTNVFYIGVLFLYSIHKEMLRWLGEKRDDRSGEKFVYIWIALTIILYVVDFFKKGYYTRSSSGNQLTTLNEITLTSLEVYGMFILTKLSKVVNTVLDRRCKF
jgi:hypothetical protein